LLFKAKTRIYLGDKVFQAGQELELDEKQYAVLKQYVEMVKVEKAEKPKETGKAEKPSPKGKNKKKE
jgi:hypothetical protein